MDIFIYINVLCDGHLKSKQRERLSFVLDDTIIYYYSFTLYTSKMSFQPVTHVLFDMDGLLLNTEELYTIAFQNLLNPFNKTYTWDLKVKIMGFQARESAQAVISAHNLPITVDEWIVESKKQFEALLPTADLMPGAKRLIEHLEKHKVLFALATSSSKEAYDLKTINHKEFFSSFPISTFGSSDPEVKLGKPHPDIFLVTADRFPDKPKPEKCLVFEDAVNGVKAARAAGMQVVMVPDSRLDKNLTSEATLVINSLEEFQPELFGLPPFDK